MVGGGELPGYHSQNDMLFVEWNAMQLLRKLAACVAIGGLAGCDTPVEPSRLSAAGLQATVEYQLQRLTSLWVSPAGAIIALQRQMGPEAEQVIGLPNDTTLQGDNLIWLRARVPEGYRVGTFRLDDLLSRFGRPTYPFERISDNDLRTGQDSMGTYFYHVWRSGAATNCVFAFRRIEGNRRLMPQRTTSLEVVLRNCVDADPNVALLPILDRQLAVGTTATAASPQGGTRTLSPLAAPMLVP